MVELKIELYFNQVLFLTKQAWIPWVRLRIAKLLIPPLDTCGHFDVSNPVNLSVSGDARLGISKPSATEHYCYCYIISCYFLLLL